MRTKRTTPDQILAAALGQAGLRRRLCCLQCVTAGQGPGWSELQIAPAATVDHVWNAVFWLFLRVAAKTLVRE